MMPADRVCHVRCPINAAETSGDTMKQTGIVPLLLACIDAPSFTALDCQAI